jgi:hypothetical protein
MLTNPTDSPLLSAQTSCPSMVAAPVAVALADILVLHKQLLTCGALAGRQGGLGLSLSSFTPSIIFGGVVMAIFSLTYYPAYQRRVGPLNACKARRPRGLQRSHAGERGGCALLRRAAVCPLMPTCREQPLSAVPQASARCPSLLLLFKVQRFGRRWHHDSGLLGGPPAATD